MGREEKERQIVETEMKGKEAEDNNKKIGIKIKRVRKRNEI